MVEKFEIITSTRHQSYVKNKLPHILMIVMCAILCGLDELGNIITFAENKIRQIFLKTISELKKFPQSLL